jgi:hypothetical protein
MVGQTRERHHFAGGSESSERVMRCVTGTAVCLHLLDTSSTAVSFYAQSAQPREGFERLSKGREFHSAISHQPKHLS